MGWMHERFGAVLGFSLILAATAACGGSKPDAKHPSSEGKSPQGDGVAVGNPAPDLSIQTLNGKGTISTGSLKGKIAIVDFWATWCGPCKQSFPKLEELSKKHAGQLEIVGVSVDDEQSGVAEFAKENGASFPIGWDEGHAIANRWDVKSMPTTYILDGTGTIRYIHAGFHDDEPEQIAKELTALLEEPSSGKAKNEVASASGSGGGESASSGGSEGSSSKEAASSPEPADPPPTAAAPKKHGKGKGGKKGGGKGAGKGGGKPKKKH